MRSCEVKHENRDAQRDRKREVEGEERRIRRERKVEREKKESFVSVVFWFCEGTFFVKDYNHECRKLMIMDIRQLPRSYCYY